ncbi:uncharacterized protein LOC111641976 [Centruroides sculpturatus]|uniref:uncharacterized protein LOC111641976 n=1 Tax=Centruroides sculpturatus TaxID=218467 RepID=UPI000C6EDBC3|nr:uncharacterized protein LOC111641976 [Centruroides sculpturatus]
MKLCVFLVSVILFIECTHCITDDPATISDTFPDFTENSTSDSYPPTTSTVNVTPDGGKQRDIYDIIDVLVSLINLKAQMIMSEVTVLGINLINYKYDEKMPEALKNISDVIDLYANGKITTEDNPIQLNKPLSQMVINFLNNLSEDLRNYYDVESSDDVKLTLALKKFYYARVLKIAMVISEVFGM